MSDFFHFFWYVHGLTKDSRFEEAALNMESSILKNAITSRGGIAWKHAENRRSPKEEHIQSGLMQGSAGFGLYFIRRYLKSKGRQPELRLPDEIE